MSQTLRKLAGIISKTGTLVIFTNQLRQNINSKYGSQEVTAGGRALTFYATMRIEIWKTNVLKDGKDTYGNETKARIVKNKLAPPYKEADFDIIFSEGASKEGCLINLGVENGLIQKTFNGWYSYGLTHLGQGYENARKYLKENKFVSSELERKLKSVLFQKII